MIATAADKAMYGSSGSQGPTTHILPSQHSLLSCVHSPPMLQDPGWLAERVTPPPLPRSTPPTRESAFWLELSSQSTIRGELTGPPSLSPQIMAPCRAGRRNAKWDMSRDWMASEKESTWRIDSCESNGVKVTGSTCVSREWPSFFFFNLKYVLLVDYPPGLI